MISCEDCCVFLSRLPDNSVDMCLVDPPYFNIANETWDKQWHNESEYLRWCEIWTKELHRVLKPNRVLCVWGTTKTDTFLRYKLGVLNNLHMSYINWIIWHYDWGGRTKKTFARKHEDCLVYAKGDSYLFNADAVRIPYKVEKNVNKEALNNPLGKIPTDVWEKNNHTCSKEYVSWHSTQKPLSILSRLILAYSNPGDIVLDCFSGSGSTAIAAHLCQRNFIGCDSSQEYVDKSLLRLKEYMEVNTNAQDVR